MAKNEPKPEEKAADASYVADAAAVAKSLEPTGTAPSAPLKPSMFDIIKVLERIRDDAEKWREQYPEGLPVNIPDEFITTYLPLLTPLGNPAWAYDTLASAYREFASGHPSWNKHHLGGA